MCRAKFGGHSYTEYAFIFALILIVALFSLNGLGGTISNLLSNTVGGSLGPSGSSTPIIRILKPVQVAAPQIDKVTGLPIILHKQGAGADTNATSIPGHQANEVGSFRLAYSLAMLTEMEPDPDKAARLARMAKAIYYMGGAEGAIKGVPQLSIQPRTTTEKKGMLFWAKKTTKVVDKYTRGAAVRDISKYQANLQKEMNEYTGDLSDPVYVTAMAIASDAMKISREFVKATDAADDPPFNELTYDQRIIYEEMKAKADVVLSDNVVESKEVEVTLSDAKMTEQLANKKNYSRKTASNKR